VLYREPMWLKQQNVAVTQAVLEVSVLYREPMWLKPG